MKEIEKTQGEYKTFQEYQKAFFPKSFKKETIDNKDPQTLGAAIAHISLERCRNKLLQK
jgi:hypothetical protein